MSCPEQLDLFSTDPTQAVPSRRAYAQPLVVDLASFEDGDLVAAIHRAATMRDCLALVAEAARRRLSDAIPALDALCRRFIGFGAARIVREQAAALDAIVAIGGSAAAQTLARLIAQRVVQGPCLSQAVAAAAKLKANLPAGTLLELLRHDSPEIRADACRCVGGGREVAFQLCHLLHDLHRDVSVAAACALGRLGRRGVRALLIRYLHEEPTAELIDAIAPIANEDCVILLGHLGREAPHLFQPALDALDTIDHPRAKQIAVALRDSRLG